MNLISRHVDARRITKNKNLIYVSVLRCFITFSLSSSSQGHHDEHWNSKDWRKDNRDLIKTSQKKFSIPLKRIKAKFPFDQPVRLNFSPRFPALKFVCCLFSKNRWKSSNRCEIYCRFWSSNVRRFEFGKKLKESFLRSNFWFWFNWKKEKFRRRREILFSPMLSNRKQRIQTETFALERKNRLSFGEIRRSA